MLNKILTAKFRQRVFVCLAFILAFVVLFNPLNLNAGLSEIGTLVIWSSILVFLQGFNRSSTEDRSSAHMSAFITFLLGMLLVNFELFQHDAIYLFTLVLFLADGMRQGYGFLKRKKNHRSRFPQLLGFIGNMMVVLALIFFKDKTLIWLIAISSGLRIAGMGIEMLTARLGVMSEVSEDVVGHLNLDDNPAVMQRAQEIEDEELIRAPIDRYWIATLLAVLFFVHLGRMGFDRSNYGILSPFIALVGDIVIALIIAYVVIIPLASFWRKLLRPIERRGWQWLTGLPSNKTNNFGFHTVVKSWLERKIRRHIRILKAGYSFKTALRTGLRIGLPYAALLASIIPVFGMSWYFDTENWASGIWDSKAALRTNDWRMSMVTSIDAAPNASSFHIKPEGVSDTGKFSFIVLGDPGEGDASQWILHDQLVLNTAKEVVKFMVISSDVVYPDGALKDYEKKFWLPMKGIHKPVYAIPGNHDWYDALEGFAVTFFDPVSARKAIQARRESDLKISDKFKEKLSTQLNEAARLRAAYQVPTGFQQAPYFQLQTKDFAFITIETGVTRSVDSIQLQWLKSTLEASKGKFIMALIGHPFYAIGEYQGKMNPEFEALHSLLRSYGVKVVMAGDTHDLEYYAEPMSGRDNGNYLHHFVNGGGGAYLSLGAALKPRNEMVLPTWAHYPASAPLIQKIDQRNNILKKPAWLWTKKYNGWPFSAEWLSAAFDYNVAPFFQCYMEVVVDPPNNAIHFLAYGPNGPLHWSDLDYSNTVRSPDLPKNTNVEWVFPLH